MRGTLMRLFTESQHKEILTAHESDTVAAEHYCGLIGRQVVSSHNARYWRKIFVSEGAMSKADAMLKESRELLNPQPDDDIGDTSFIPSMAECILAIPDIHAPYQHPDALKFLVAVKKTFEPDLCINLGDELDYHALSFHDSDPNLDSAGAELEKAKEFLRLLHKEFPKLLICHSNHGSMVFRRARAHGIPVQMIKRYRDVLFPKHGAPFWSWASSWKVNTPLGRTLFKHQTTNILSDAAHNACNLVVGHEHGKFTVEYSASSAHLYYGMHAGCLIDNKSLAFAYGKHSLRKPIIGCGVILQGRPMVIPMVLNDKGRWIGRL